MTSINEILKSADDDLVRKDANSVKWLFAKVA